MSSPDLDRRTQAGRSSPRGKSDPLPFEWEAYHRADEKTVRMAGSMVAAPVGTLLRLRLRRGLHSKGRLG